MNEQYNKYIKAKRAGSTLWNDFMAEMAKEAISQTIRDIENKEDADLPPAFRPPTVHENHMITCLPPSHCFGRGVSHCHCGALQSDRA